MQDLTVMLFNLECKRRKWNLVICDVPRPLNLWLLLQKPWKLLVHQRPCTMMRLRTFRRPFISFRMKFLNWGRKNSNLHTMELRLVLTFIQYLTFFLIVEKWQILHHIMNYFIRSRKKNFYHTITISNFSPVSILMTFFILSLKNILILLLSFQEDWSKK